MASISAVIITVKRSLETYNFLRYEIIDSILLIKNFLFGQCGENFFMPVDTISEKVDGLAVRALSVRSRKQSNVSMGHRMGDQK
jgi:hypothetical protein